MMRLVGSLCGELQIAKQKDRIARCRAASLDTLFSFVVVLRLDLSDCNSFQL